MNEISLRIQSKNNFSLSSCFMIESFHECFLYASFFCDIGGLKAEENVEKLFIRFFCFVFFFWIFHVKIFLCNYGECFWENFNLLAQNYSKIKAHENESSFIMSSMNSEMSSAFSLVIHSFVCSQKKLNRIEIKIKFTHGFIRFTKKLMWKFSLVSAKLMLRCKEQNFSKKGDDRERERRRMKNTLRR